MSDEDSLLDRAKVTAALLMHEFEPECSAPSCRRLAVWSYECVYECWMGGFACKGHHDFAAVTTANRRCERCGNVAPLRNLLVFRSLAVIA